ncbi:STAS domain-containing protein [Saccharibacillus sp. CPCC 101409]|uniref:STAS domain-containing protein n=1 Tax=Saccharibacillus sp. CPCC 101409 TaxID=3058041 RepID=UPI00267297DB|nr:STAS domain-containing protein [Saccharibacillus sp. CPCC 101409]MDO3409112.1 STAS domain-containing protein [Saccharibacillus sp. CPCC 101409]
MFAYKIQENGQEAIVMFEGDIDIDSSEVVEEDILPAVSAYSSIRLNFGEVYFVDSSGIGLIIRMVDELREAERNVRIEAVRPEVMEVFELLQIHEILGEEVFG